MGAAGPLAHASARRRWARDSRADCRRDFAVHGAGLIEQDQRAPHHQRTTSSTHRSRSPPVDRGACCPRDSRSWRSCSVVPPLEAATHTTAATLSTALSVAALSVCCNSTYTRQVINSVATVSALSVAAVVCVAASNGGTTSRRMLRRTSYLVAARPRRSTGGDLDGADVVAGHGGHAGTVDQARTCCTIARQSADLSRAQRRRADAAQAGQQHPVDDPAEYKVWHATEVPQGKYLVDDSGKICYLVDPGHQWPRQQAQRREQGWTKNFRPPRPD